MGAARLRPGTRVRIERLGTRVEGRVVQSPATRPGWVTVRTREGAEFEADPAKLTPVAGKKAARQEINLATPSRRARAALVEKLIEIAVVDHAANAPLRGGRELLDAFTVEFRSLHIARTETFYRLMRERLDGGEELDAAEWVF